LMVHGRALRYCAAKRLDERFFIPSPFRAG
jgi:hypothetical protein